MKVLVIMAIDRKTAIQSGTQFASLIRSTIDNNALVLLFGSCARNENNDRSDIDIAVVSNTFGSNVVENRARINLLGFSVHPDIEAHPFSLIDWEYTTPFIEEIKSSGVAL
jgi:predicted nucleotidyltransferase